jgi:cytochrome c-type biogenesis protein CcmH
MVTGAIAAGVALLVLAPVFRRRPPPLERDAFEVQIFKDQLAEIERDRRRGAIDAANADALRLEVERRMLATVPRDRRSVSEAAEPRSARRWVPVAAVSLAVVMALAVYGSLGSPDFADQPLAARDPAGSLASPGSLDAAIVALQRRLAEAPDDGEAWQRLGRVYMALGRYGEAAEALAKAEARRGGDATVAADRGEALVAAGQGEVTPDAGAAFRRALALDAANPRARYYLALQKAQAGEVGAALQDWLTLAGDAPADAPWLEPVRARVAEAAAVLGIDPATLPPTARLPAGEDGTEAPDAAAIAALPADERAAAIRQMVDRLAARLEAEPGDQAGWQRLARAYEVLGETEKAEAARKRAAEAADGRRD